MKHITAIIIIVTIIVCSCKTPVPETYTWETPESVFVEDRNWLDTLVFYEYYTNRERSNFTVYCGLSAKYAAFQRIEYAFEYPSNSPFFSKSPLTPAEKYAVDRILERNKVFQDYYDSIEQNTQVHHYVSNIYVRETPRVYADKVLFGKSAGEDISSYFSIVSTSALFRCAGPEYQVLERGRGSRLPWSDYFSEGVMLPLMMFFRSTMMPEELTEDYDVTLTFVFPVTIEHYWSWLLEQYSNPNAEESWTDTDMVLVAYIKGDMEAHDWLEE